MQAMGFVNDPIHGCNARMAVLAVHSVFPLSRVEVYSYPIAVIVKLVVA